MQVQPLCEHLQPLEMKMTAPDSHRVSHMANFVQGIYGGGKPSRLKSEEKKALLPVTLLRPNSLRGGS